MASDSGNGAPSPRSFAMQHQRPRDSFVGCSRITDYELLGKLGEGTFGEVHKAKSRRTGSLVALKKIIMHNEKDGFPITALREIKLLKLLSHRNVLRLEDMAVEHHSKMTDKRKRPIMYMVTPYMDHDLSGLLDNPSVHFTVPQIKCYLMQLLEGLRYLHESKILHRDMKAANLLINNRGILQIADFGLARHYDGPVPKPGAGGGEGRREYTSLVVTRWYRPPELLLHLKKYTTAIDMWGVGCVFGEMLVGKPILAGESDEHQLHIIFDLVGSPTEATMPGWKQLPGGEGMTPKPRPPALPQRFREHGTSAISLLKELLTLDWRKRINAIDALEHPYFKSHPYPAKPEDIPRFEDSHELDRRKFHDRKAALPPAPKGGTVGVGAFEGPNASFGSGDGYGNRMNGGRYPPHHGGHRNGEDGRRPAWVRDQPRHEHRLPPRPPPPEHPPNGWDGPMDYRERERPPRNRGGGGGANRPDVDTYIPSYRGGRDDRPPRDDRLPPPPRDDRLPLRDDRPPPPRDDRLLPPRDDRLQPRDDRRRWEERDDRRYDWDRRERDYDDRSRTSKTRSRSRSPLRDRERELYRR
ncbi:serine/threonine protein kinase, CMGC, CDC2/CDK subfamily [Diatrype stigma]|uniref:Serine/threonine-protein kinase BUR1 n=1 Tax=Diatrype stigma TaxID=117547 RepID=A0AAN9US95_9PEZI